MDAKTRSEIEGERTFTTEDGVTYTVEVYWDTQDPQSIGWAYRVSDDHRGSLDSGALDTDDPWAEVARMFPELEG